MKETDWHHAPLHRFVPGAVHMITAGTLDKRHFFRGREALGLFQDVLLQGVAGEGWITMISPGMNPFSTT